MTSPKHIKVVRWFIVGVGVIALLGSNGWVSAQERERLIVRGGDPNVNPADAVTLPLSQALPGPLGQYVARFGEDREITFIPSELKRQLAESEPSASKVIDVLLPRVYFYVPGPVVLKQQELASNAAEGNQAAVDMVIAGTRLPLGNGTRIAFGDLVPVQKAGCQDKPECVASPVLTGLVLNAGDTDVLVDGPDGIALLASGEALYVATAEEWKRHLEQQPDGGVAKVNGCSVSCKSTHYACCTDGGLFGSDTCKCIIDGQQANCDSGGAGSSSCSINAAQ